MSPEILKRLEEMGDEDQQTTTIPTQKYEPDGELKKMEAGLLLPRIRQDTGEMGKEIGDRIEFKNCPVCGHKDCFKFYPGSDSWNCFSTSNHAEYDGGDFITYLQVKDGVTRAEAIAELRRLTGNERPQKADRKDEPEAVADEKGEPKSAPRRPPRAVPFSKLSRNHPKEFIPGVMRFRRTALIAGGNKCGKTWVATLLAVAAASGGKWLGMDVTKCGRVLFVNPEVAEDEMQGRIAAALEKAGCGDDVGDNIDVVTLRAAMKDDGLWSLPEVMADKSGYGLIIIDTASFFVKNDADPREVRALGTYCNMLAESMGAAVVLVHHFRKDRCTTSGMATEMVRGTSVWVDMVDACLTLQELFPPDGMKPDGWPEGQMALVLKGEAIRAFSRLKPTHLVCMPPVYMPDFTGLTDDWTTTPGKPEAVKVPSADPYEVEILFYMLTNEVDCMTCKEAMDMCVRAGLKSIRPQNFKPHIVKARHLDVDQTSNQRWSVRLKRESA